MLRGLSGPARGGNHRSPAARGPVWKLAPAGARGNNQNAIRSSNEFEPAPALRSHACSFLHVADPSYPRNEMQADAIRDQFDEDKAAAKWRMRREAFLAKHTFTPRPDSWTKLGGSR